MFDTELILGIEMIFIADHCNQPQEEALEHNDNKVGLLPERRAGGHGEPGGAPGGPGDHRHHLH